MPWKQIGAIVAIALIGGAFLAGYLPEHALRTAAESDAQSLRERLDSAEAHVRVARLLGQVLTLKEVAMRQNYGQAQDLSSSFFDNVRAETAAASTTEFRDLLSSVLARRDPVTAALTKADGAVVEVLHSIELQMRRALGYPVPPEATPLQEATPLPEATLTPH